MDSSSSSPDYSQLQKPLEHFRAKTTRVALHRLEMAALGIVCAHLVFLPWAIGGMRLWGQLISLSLAVIGFAVALMPRDYTGEDTGTNSFRLLTWPKLTRFPIFWIGLALLGLVIVQALNPAWAYESDGRGWWMKRIDHATWLPAGVREPFEKGGPWRALIIYASAWLTVCTIWTAFTRRRTVQLLFLTLAINGVALAAFGLGQRMLGNGKLFGFWKSPNDSFFASFIYKNHAGAYLNLSLIVTCGLAAWYYFRGLRRFEKSNPSGLFAFFALMIAVSVLVSYARGATLVMLLFLAVTIVGFILHQLLAPTTTRKPIIAIILVGAFLLFLKTGLDALNSKQAWKHLERGLAGEDGSLKARKIATRAATEMLADYWVAGAGAGSFSALFPIYQQRYPEILSEDGKRAFWEHAHNDLVEFPLEFGLPGMLLLIGAAACGGIFLARRFFWENPLSLCLVFGLVLSLAYGWWDFPFHCPAILVTWCALWAAVALWTNFEELKLKG